MKKVYLTQCGQFAARHGHGGTLAEASHEHNFHYEITFHGPLNEEGYLIDFRVLQHFFTHKINTRLHHADLNTLFPNPTTETLAIWLFERVQAQFPFVYSVKVAEESDRWIEYRGEE